MRQALDLFCGVGGASVGLARAGFEVTGVDIRPQPRYPFRFIRADALAPPLCLHDFALIWASPPCQAFSAANAAARAAGRVHHPNLIPAVRRMLGLARALTVIENVPFAPLRPDLILDGTMFPALRVVRRRWFETSWWPGLAPPSRIRRGMIAAGYSCVAGGGRSNHAPVAANAWHTTEARARAMGIDWPATRDEVAQAVPPAYAEFIGRSAAAVLDQRGAA